MNSRTKNRFKLIFITVLFALPVMTAWLVFSNPQWLEGGATKNYGELISPAIPSNITDFIMDATEDEIKPLKGRWVMLHIDLDAKCSTQCEKSVHVLKQLHTLLNKDSKRLRRVYLHKSDGSLNQSLTKDAKLSVFLWNSERIQKLTALVQDAVDGDVLLLDPLGNIMMKYHEDADPYGIQKDLKLLFKASQIG
jgi:hypothetical protein